MRGPGQALVMVSCEMWLKKLDDGLERRSVVQVRLRINQDQYHCPVRLPAMPAMPGVRIVNPR